MISLPKTPLYPLHSVILSILLIFFLPYCVKADQSKELQVITQAWYTQQDRIDHNTGVITKPQGVSTLTNYTYFEYLKSLSFISIHYPSSMVFLCYLILFCCSHRYIISFFHFKALSYFHLSFMHCLTIFSFNLVYFNLLSIYFLQSFLNFSYD